MRCRWTVWLAALSASCQGEPFVGTVSRSQFFEYHDQVQEPLCPTLLSSLDRHAQLIGGKVGLSLDAHNPYRYYKFRNSAALVGTHSCSAEFSACALGDSLYASTYFHAHEQAHDYVYRAWGGWSDGLLNEGEAVALSCNPFYQLEPGQRAVDVLGAVDWRSFLNLYGDSNIGYGAAGFLVTYLAERYGWASVAALHRKVPRGASADEFVRAFAEVFPTSIDQAWADALGTAGASPCQRDWRCITAPMAVGDVAAPDCDGEIHRSVDVGAPGAAVLTVTGDNVQLMLLDCAAATPTAYTLEGFGAQPTTHWASLPPGSYALLGDPSTASVTLRSYVQGSLVGSACDSAPSVALDAGGATIVDFLPGRVDGWMRITGGGGQTFSIAPYNLFWNNPLSSTAISICDGCGAAASCAAIAFGEATPVVVGDQSVVRFQGAIANPGMTAAWGQLIFDVSP